MLPLLWPRIVEERLDHSVVIRATLLVAGERPNVVDEYSVNPRTAFVEVQHDERRSQAPVVIAEFSVALRGGLHDGACAQDPFTWFGRREKRIELEITDAAKATSSGPSAGCQITGRMVRVMMFQSSLIEIGITGWILSMFCVPFSGPNFKLVLF